MKTIITFLLILSSLFSFGQNKEYKNELSKMFELNGTEEIFNTYIEQMIPMIKDLVPDIDADVWNELEKEIYEVGIDDLLVRLIPVYYEYLSLEDLKSINKFYRTDAGEKLVEQTPLIMKDSMKIGEEWGRQIGERVEQRLREKGYL